MENKNCAKKSYREMKEEFLSLPKVDGEREGAIDGLDILRRVREEESAEDASGNPGETKEEK